MGFLDTVRSYLPGGEDETTQLERATALNRQHSGDPFADLREEIEETPPEEVADKFAGMAPDKRLAFVLDKNISPNKWEDMRSVIRNDSDLREMWGLDSSLVDNQDGLSVCACHKTEVETLTVTDETGIAISQTQGTSEASKTEMGSKVGGSGGVGVSGVGNVNATGEVSTKKGWTQGETQKEMAQATDTTGISRPIYSCRIDRRTSPLSRRAFLYTGDFVVGKHHDRETNNTQNTLEEWNADTKDDSAQRESQKGIDTLQAEKNEIVDQIEELDEELEMYDDRIEQNTTFISQCEDAIAESEGAIDVEDLDKRDRLLEKHEELKEKKGDIRAKRNQFRTQKSDLQGRIEDHDEYEEAREEADTAESMTQDADENATEEPAAESEEETEETSESESTEDVASEQADDESVSETTNSAGDHDDVGNVAETESEQATETNTTGQTTDDTPESDGGSPTEDGGDDPGGESESETADESTTAVDADPTQATEPSPDGDAASPETDDSSTETTETSTQGDEILAGIQSATVENGYGENVQMDNKKRDDDSGSSM